MSKKPTVKKVLKSFVDVPRWIGFSSLRATGSQIGGMARNLFSTAKPQFEETYEEAVQRMQLSEEALQKRMTTFFRMAVLYFVIGLCLLVYTGVLFFYGHLTSTMLSLVLSFVLFTFAFREHFWYTQMKLKRLGCTFKEWFAYLISGKKPGNQK
jgi:intracellular multiplication protein IcmV